MAGRRAVTPGQAISRCCTIWTISALVLTASVTAKYLPLDMEFSNFEKTMADCGTSMASTFPKFNLHKPSTCDSVLDEMQNGRRAGLDKPFLLDNCDIQWYTPSEACEVLANAGQVLILGDSFMRHFTNGMFVVLNGNYQDGALGYHLNSRVYTEEEALRWCSCENQFTEKQCRSHTMKFVGPHHYEITYQDKDFHFKWDEGPNGAVYVGTEECKRQRVSVAWFPAYKHHDLDIDFLEYVLGWSPRNVVIAGSALHAKLNGTDIAENLVAPLKALLDRAPGDNTLIVTGSHALGNAIKQAELSEAVLTVQTNPNVLAMNAHLAKYCKQHSIHYFDPFALSTNSSTFDGQHHSGAVNTLKAQMLLNFLAELQRKPSGKLTSAAQTAGAAIQNVAAAVHTAATSAGGAGAATLSQPSTTGATTLAQPSTTGATTLAQPSTTGASSTGAATAAGAADPTLHARRTGSLAGETTTAPERPARRAHSYEAAEAERR